VKRKIREKLTHCVDPLDPSQHPDALINVVTGSVSTEVNVDNAATMGKNEMEELENS